MTTRYILSLDSSIHFQLFAYSPGGGLDEISCGSGLSAISLEKIFSDRKAKKPPADPGVWLRLNLCVLRTHVLPSKSTYKWKSMPPGN